VTAEPYTTFLSVSVTDRGLNRGQEVAYESVVLGRLTCGYRVLQLRAPCGTRIELAYLFVQITTGTMAHQWPTVRQVISCAALPVRQLMLSVDAPSSYHAQACTNPDASH